MRPDSKRSRRPQSLDHTAGAALLNDLQALNTALSSHQPPPDPHHRRKSSPSLWKWSPFKALSHLGHRRFDCRFSLRVHFLKSLPPDLNGCSLSVSWRRAGTSPSAQATRPARVSRSSADFRGALLEEDCHVYGHKTGHRGTAKYEPRQFVVSVVVVGEAKRVLLGEHRVDLTSLLPSSLDYLERSNCSRELTTSFRLGGRAGGALMSVTFGFSIVRDDLVDGPRSRLVDAAGEEDEKLGRTESLSVVERVSKGWHLGGEAMEEAARVVNVDSMGECNEESCVTVDQLEDEITLRDVGVEVSSKERHVHLGLDGPKDTVRGEVWNGGGKQELEFQEFKEAGGQWKLKEGKLLKINGEKKSKVHIPKADGGEKFDEGDFLNFKVQARSEDSESVDICALGVVEYKESEDPEFTVVEQGMETVSKEYELATDSAEIEKADTSKFEVLVSSQEKDTFKGKELLTIDISKHEAQNGFEEKSLLIDVGGSVGEKLDSAICILEPSVPAESPRAKLEHSLFHGSSILDSSTLVHPQSKLEDSGFHGPYTIESSETIDSLRWEAQDSVSGELSTTEISGFTDAPRALLKHSAFDVPPTQHSSTTVGSSQAKLESSVRFGSCTFESYVPVDSEQENLEHSMIESNLLLTMSLNSTKISMPSELPKLNLDNLGSPDHTTLKSSYKSGRISKSLSMDNATESVANEFLAMLGLEQSLPMGLNSDSEAESPRERLLKQFSKDDAWKQFASTSSSDIESPKERLWRQFQKECSADGGGFLCPDIGGVKESNWDDDFDLTSIVHAAESEQEKVVQEMTSKTRAKLLEDAETEALMHEMGLNEKSFKSLPPETQYGFGSPIDFHHDDPFELPPLGDGLGPCIPTKDGGFLRSMSHSLFRNAKNNGSLIMQVSSPIVVPAEMGSGVMDILQGLASIGIEKLSMQANKLMPLEDVTGKSMQQVAWEALPSLEESKRYSQFGGNTIFDGKKKMNMGYSRRDEAGSEYVSLEDLAPLAMDKIEALSVEGLRIQSGMSEGEAPANIFAQSLGEISALQEKHAKNTLELEGAAAMRLMDVKNTDDEVDGLMGLSVSLDEWMRLDSGLLDEKDADSERTTKILAAHHAKSTEFISGGCKGDRKGGKGSGKRWGLLGNNFTVALMVQLRDPMRNYEPVGTPMLALIQVERVFVPPKPKIYCTVSTRGNSVPYDDEEPEKMPESKAPLEEKEEETSIPVFKVTEVHIAGLKHEPSKKSTWGNQTQQSSGSRWLLATGMGKNNKHPFLKSKAVSKPLQSTTAVHPGDTLWSISSGVHGTGKKWKEIGPLNPHIRNPNVILPNQTIRMR